jgi:putative restriction endonuclease
MARRSWTRDELLIAFSLYCRLPFGRYHRGNSQVKRVAEAIGRTPSAVAMRLSNFASLDPMHQSRGVKGLGSTGPALKAFWSDVTKDWTRTAVDSELAWDRMIGHSPTEAEGRVKIRLVQGFFRRTVLASYGGTCAVCGIRPEQLLTAGHIIPWSQNKTRRADPTNGLCLCALHDRAFDAGLLGIDEGLRVIVSPKLDVKSPSRVHEEALLRIHNQPITSPTRYHPDPKALQWHRDRIFKR